jgi:hypothetical protein
MSGKEKQRAMSNEQRVEKRSDSSENDLREESGEQRVVPGA